MKMIKNWKLKTRNEKVKFRAYFLDSTFQFLVLRELCDLRGLCGKSLSAAC